MPTPPPIDLPRLPPRVAAASKRDFGRVVVVGGSVGMAGAPALSAMAALRSGAGLVELVVPEPVAGIAAGFDPCVMTHGLPATAAGTFAADAADMLAPLLARAGAVAIGPGLGRSAEVRDLVLHVWRTLAMPAVFDADALWALSAAGVVGAAAGPRLLTPHAGEMLRLLGGDPSGPEADDRPRLESEARRFAAAHDGVVLLKGAGTLVTDGLHDARNPTGNPGMATAGTGDVLTGVAVALLTQGMPVFDAARLAAWVHGRAGDAAAADLGQVSMTARDVLDRLHVAFRELD
ncbi:MAG: NAD(P)H-hydrate dehydratase [Planctomycetaceae bacterium]